MFNIEVSNAEGKKVSAKTVLIVTFSLVGNTKCRRRQRQTEGFSHPFGLCHNPGTVKNFHPHRKPHFQVWGKKKKHFMRFHSLFPNLHMCDRELTVSFKYHLHIQDESN